MITLCLRRKPTVCIGTVPERGSSDPVTERQLTVSNTASGGVARSGKAAPMLPLPKPGTTGAVQQAARSAAAGLASHPLDDIAEDVDGGCGTSPPVVPQIGTVCASKDLLRSHDICGTVKFIRRVLFVSAGIEQSDLCSSCRLETSSYPNARASCVGTRLPLHVGLMHEAHNSAGCFTQRTIVCRLRALPPFGTLAILCAGMLCWTSRDRWAWRWLWLALPPPTPLAPCGTRCANLKSCQGPFQQRQNKLLSKLSSDPCTVTCTLYAS